MAGLIEKRVKMLGLTIDNLTKDEVLAKIDDMILNGKPSIVCTANANHVRLVRVDPEFAKIDNGADLITADGMSLIWASKFLGHPLREKFSGIDLVADICKASSERGYRIYFLGAAPGIAEKAKARCEKIYPGVRIVGLYSPSREEIMDDPKSRAIVEKINASTANILCIAFGTPLQEKWVTKHLSLLKIPVSVMVGGAIDYLAEIIKRPPLIVQKLGLEWLARLIQDPRRYWKRYLKDLLIFYYFFLELLKIDKNNDREASAR